MPSLTSLALLLLLGAAHDALAFRCYAAAHAGRVTEAATLAGLLSAFSFAAWFLAQATGAEATAAGIAAYSLGASLGTAVALSSTRRTGTTGCERG